MKIIISQPRYLPALNYINRLAKADKFILLDTVQRQSRGWENRNKLLCNGKPKWLSIPIESSSRALIYETKIKGSDWVESHKNTIRNYYRKAPFFDESIIQKYYSGVEQNLENYNYSFLFAIKKTIKNLESILGFESSLAMASQLEKNKKDWLSGPEELKRIAELAGATTYISGPNAKDYGIENVFRDIDVKYHNYHHPVYEQMNDEFVEYLGFFDAVFNAGVDQVSDWIGQDLNITENIEVE